ncbi:MAG: CDP-alcohol phosphatidyltransferase family protein [Patescibacteria group bacterium]|nr:CDP-alcohol phosphatidyltransferase family protein [Patescibacteria group bacterium]
MKKIEKFILSQNWIKADLITYLRFFIFAPLVIFLSLIKWYATALIFYLMGLLTDALDGYVARLKNQVKEKGTILDASADKIFIIIPFLILGFRFLNLTFVILVVVLEIIHVLVVLFSRFLRLPLKTAANFPNRIKMWFLGLGLGFLLLAPFSLAFLSSTFLHLAIVSSFTGTSLQIGKILKN